MTGQLLFWGLSALAVFGALTVVSTKDVTRLTLGLGAFLFSVAGFFAYFGFGFLALAQLFVYVGGVLVLVLFAVMLVHRSQPGKPSLESRHDLLVLVACAGLGALVLNAMRPLVGYVDGGQGSGAGMDALGELLLGSMLPHFELAGALLLGALVAVVTISGGERR